MRRLPEGRLFARCKVAQAVALALVSGVTPTALHALPDGGQVSAGAATIQRAGSAMTVSQSSDRASINWQSFGIGPAESLRFVQPGPASIVLNRVVGQDPSLILGSLSANGQVFLVNPNGVLFGSGAQVSVGGIVASTLQLSDADFLAGRIAFSRGPRAGEVVNQGSVTAASGGYVAFLGPQVRNEGVINARLGTVVLAAGERATLNFADNRLVSFAVDAGALDALAENRHLIQADGGQVVLTAKAADALARSVVNNTGIVQATTIAEQNGVIRLEGGAISNSGTISAAGGGRIMLAAERDITLAPTSLITASGARGGDVTLQARSGTLLTDGRIEAAGTDAQGGTLRLLGDRVGLVNSASVDASGASGGGTVLAGGDYQGKNPDVQNATHTYAGPQTSIRADATASGDGGKVILWADDATRFYGAISARGGPAGGNGGFVETSGKRFLDAQGLADASAPRGAAGQWLLDPNNITINSAGPNTNVGATPNFTSTDDNAIVTTLSIQAALNAGTSVTVTTASAGANTQAGDITVANAIAKTAGGNATLTLTATNGITFSAGANVTSTTGQLGLALTAGTGGITSLQAVNTNGGALTLNSTGSMTQSGVISGAGTVVKQGSGTLTLSSANTYTGATTVSAGTLAVTNNAGLGTTAGGVTVASGATLDLRGVTVGAEALTVNGGTIATSTGTSSHSGTLALGANSTVSVAGTQLTLSGVMSGVGFGIGKQGAGTLLLSGANTFSGGIAIKAGTLAGSVASAFGTGTVTLGDSTGAANATLSGAGAVNFANPITVASGNTGTATITDTANSTFSGAVTLSSHDLTLARAANNLILSGGITGTGNLALSTSGAGTLTLSTASVNNTGTITNSGAGAGAATISTSVGANVTSVTQNSTTSALTLSGGLVMNGVGTTKTLTNSSGTALLTVSTTATSGTGNLVLDNDSATAAGITVSAGVNHTGLLTNAGSGAGGVTVSGVVGTNVSGVVQNSATSALNFTTAVNTYTSGLTIKSGTVTGTLANSFGANTNVITLGDSTGAANATLSGAGAVNFANPITVASGNTGTATITDTANSTFSGAVTLSSHDLTLARAANNLILSGGITGTGNLALNTSGAGTLTLSTASVNNTGTITNSGAGAGAATISAVVGTNVSGVVQNSATSALNFTTAVNTYTSGLTIKSGTVTGTLANSFGANTNVITLGDSTGTSSATLRGAGAVTFANPITVASGNTGIATITDTANSTFSGAVTLNNHDLTLTAAANNLTLSGSMTGTGNVTLNASGAGVITKSGTANHTGTITNSGVGAATSVISAAIGANVTGVTQNSATSALTLSGANTYGGDTTISAGTLNANGGSAIPNGSQVTLADVAGAVLNLGAGETIGNLSGGGASGGNVTLGANTLTVNEAGTTSYAGVISGTGALTKTGTGPLTLSGANTYTGATTVSAGTLVAANSAALGGSGTGTTVASGAELDISGSGLTIAEPLTSLIGTGVSGGGALRNLANNNAWTGAITLGATGARINSDSGTLTISTGAITGATQPLTVGGAGNTTISSVIGTTSGTLTKDGAGALTLSGANTYTGTTAVNAGTLAVTVNTALGTNAAGTTVATGATLDLQNVTYATAEPVTLNGGTLATSTGTSSFAGAVTISSASAVNVGGSLALNGTVEGPGDLSIAGAGTLTLANTVGSTTPLASLTGAAATTLNLNGSLVRTTGNQSYSGPVITGGAITLRTAGGTVSAGGAVNASAGTLTFNTGAGDVAMNNAANNFSSVAVTSANSVSLTDANAIQLGMVSIANNLTVTAVGITQDAGGLSVGGTATFNAGAGPITLTTPTNNLVGAVSLNNSGANNVAVTDANAIVIGTSSVGTGTLAVISDGTILQTGPITQAPGAGAASFTATANALISLTQPNDFTGAVSASNVGGSDILITDANALKLGTVSPGSGDLTLVANGAITQTGPLTVGGKTSVAAGAANDITLNHAANVFSGQVRIVSGNNVTLNDNGAFVFGNGGPSVISGNLVLTAAGAISQTQPVSVGGTTSLDAGGSFTIALTNSNNDFTGAVSATNTGTNDISITDVNALVLGTISPGPGDLRLVSDGPITQVGPITTSGAGRVSIDAGAANDITLNHASNSIAGELRIISGNNVTLNDGGALAFGFGGASVISGNLVVTAAGPVSQTRAINVAGATSISAGANSITLTNNNNDFTGAVSLNNSGPSDVAIKDTNAIVLGASSVGSGTLTVTADGTITQTGSITQAAGAGATSVGAGANAITLTNPGNDFTGAVSLSNSGASDVSVVDANSLTLGASTVGRNLNAAAGGRLTVSGMLTTGGSTGTSIELSGAAFTNTAGAAALAPGAGSRFLVWSANTNPFGGATPDDRGALAYDFKQYDATFGVTPVAQATGNGFLYALAPTITPGLTGTVSKAYDGSTSATLAAGNYAAGGAVDGDTVTLNNPTSGAYDTRNAGTGKNVSVSGIAFVGATNGGKPVYGYQMAATTANANIGEITAAPLTVTAQTDSRGYNGTTSSAVAPVVTGTQYDALGTAATQSYDNKNVGTTHVLTASGLLMNDGNSGNNYAITYVPSAATGVITVAPLTVTAQSDSRSYNGTTSSAVAPVVTGTQYDAIGTVATQTYDNKNVGTTHVLSASGLVMNDGNSGNNYSITYAPSAASGVIIAAPLTVTAQSDSRGYNGTTSSAVAPVVTGTQYDSVGTNATQTYDNKNVGTTHVLSASGLVMNDGNSGNNYSITYAPSTATGVIIAAPITVTAQTDSRGYNGTTSSAVAPVVTGTQYEAIGTAATQSYDNKNVGTTHVLSASGLVMNDGNSGNNYLITYVPSAATGVITAAPLTVTAQTDSRGYNATTSSAVAPVVTGSLYDPIGTGATQTYDNKHVGTTHVLTASGLVMNDGNAGANYSITYAPSAATGVITAAPLTVTAQSDSRGYNGTTNSAVAPVLTGTQYDVVGTSATQSYDNKNVGTTHVLSASGLVMNDGNSGNNYSITYAPSTATGVIIAAPLTVTAQTDSRGYNGTTSSSVLPVVTGTQYDALGTAATQSYDNKNVGTTHVLSASGLLMNDGNSGNNYAITYVPSAAAGVIIAAPLTVTAQSDSRVYNGTTSSVVASVITGTQYDAIGTVATQTFDNKNVGTTHVLSSSGLVMNDGNSGNNYSITYAPSAATGVITAAPLTVTAAANIKTYDGTMTAAVTPTVSGLQPGDSVTGLAEVYADKNAGTGKTLSVSAYTVNDGNSGNNYSVSTVNNMTGVITAAPLTVTAQSDSRGYNGTTSSGAAPVLTGTQYDALGTAATQAYDNKHVGTTHVLNANGLVMNDGNSGNNYSITYVPSAATGVITAAPLTVTAQTDSRSYNGTTSSSVAPVPTGTQYDAVGTAATQTYDNKNVGATHVLSATGLVMNDGNSGNNYSITYVPSAASGIINAASLTITAATNTRIYDGSVTAVATPTVSGLQPGDTVTGLAEVYANKHAGSGKTLSVASYFVNDGNGGNNYTVTTVNNTTGVITAAPLTVTAQTDNRVYNGTTSSSVLPVLTGTQYDPVGTAATQSYDNKNVGTTHVLSASGLVINDGNGGNNYAITYMPSAATGIITAAPLSVTAQTDNRIYNGTKGSSVAPVVSGTQYDTVGTAATQTYDNRNVGTTHVLRASGLVMNDGNSSNNYAITYVSSAATGVITAAPLTVTAQTDSRVYNGTTSSAVAPVLTGTQYDPVELAATQAYDNKNASTTHVLSASGLVMNDGNSGNNYAITYVPSAATGVITAVPLTIIADDKARLQGAANPPLTATYSGFVASEGPANLSGALVLGTPAVVASPPGAYAITAGGHASTNYIITYVDGVLTVIPSGGGAGGGAGLSDAISFATQQGSGASGSPTAPSNPVGSQGLPVQQVYQVDGTGIRLPPGLQR